MYMACADVAVSQPSQKGKKKKKKEEAGKKIPKIIYYLFHKGGLEEKNVKQEPDGWVYVDNILDVEAYSDYLEEDVFDILSENKEYELKQCSETGTLMVRSIPGVEIDTQEPVKQVETADEPLPDKDKFSKKKSRRRRSRGNDHGDAGEEETDAYFHGNQHAVAPHTGRTENRRARHGAQVDDIFVSKTLSWLLRHGAVKSGFKLQEGGFLYVEEVLQLPKLKDRFTCEDIQRIVETNEKQRFFMEPHPENGKLRIRANQGHSMQVEGLDLTPITSATEVPVVLHGTYRRNWASIEQEGLKKMKRAHIHFASGEPKESGVISGMRASCDVLIFIGLAAALEGLLIM